jgi:hypothetical protein
VPIIQTPDGPVNFPDSMKDADIESVLQKQYAPKVAGAGPLGVPSPAAHPSVSMNSSSLPGAALTLGDLGKGIVKGGLNTINGVSSLIHSIPGGIGKALVPQSGLTAAKMYAEPHGTAQKIGKGTEQAAEFLLPGLGEEGAGLKLAEMAPQLGRAAVPLARIGVQALGSGLINKNQGGSFETGAVSGGLGAGVGEGLKMAAPTLTGIAQGLKSPFQKTGTAILDETSGVMPSSIRSSARGVLNDLTPQLNEAAENSTTPISLSSSRNAAQSQVDAAKGLNQQTLINGTKKMQNQLLSRFAEPAAGAEGPMGRIAIPDEVPASQFLQLKRGIGKALPAGSWSPESSNAFKGARNSVYGAMNDELENAVPEAAPLNSRISALIPATKKAENVYFGHALGPATGAILGGFGGARRGLGPSGTDIPAALGEGALGALSGGLVGAAIPAGMNTVARMAWSPALQKMVPMAVGGALQYDRSK